MLYIRVLRCLHCDAIMVYSRNNRRCFPLDWSTSPVATSPRGDIAEIIFYPFPFMSKETSKLYGGDVELVFDSGQHIYTANGKKAFGVTSIVGIIDKPALMYWAAKMSAERFKDLIKPGKSYGEVELATMYDEIKGAHRRPSGRAKATGTIVHEAIEAIINALIAGDAPPERPVDDVVNKCIDSFASWVKNHEVKFLQAERKVYSQKYNYAGTLDVLAEVDGNLTVADIKTSAAVYPEYHFQNVAYLKAVEEEDGSEIKDALILRVDKDGGELEVVKTEDVEACFDVFKACHEIYMYQMKQKDIK